MLNLAVFVRFVHFSALAFLLGGFAFLLFVARPAFKRAGGDPRPMLESLDRLVLRLSAWALLIALVSGLLWLWIQAAIVTGQSLRQALTLEAIGGVLTKTQFGQVWQLRLGLVVLLMGFLLFRERERDDKDWLALRVEGVILGGGLMATLAWAGHAAATQGRALPVHLASDVVHLLAAGVWLGGLLPLALLLARARRFLDASWATVAREATRRFSLLGLVSVSVLVLSGVVNEWMIVGDLPHLVGTPYGRLLLLKLALLIPLIAIAAVNLLRLRPQLLASPDSDAGDALRELLRRLRRNVIGEICLGATILLIVGALGITPPARHLQPWWPFPFRLSWEVNKDLSGWGALVASGLAVALGLVAFAYAFLRQPHRPWAMGVGLALVGLSVLPLRTLAVDANPATYYRPAIRYSAISVANGSHLYREHCAVCHGVAGYGDGPAAAGLQPRPADLTAKHTADHTAGDLFWWLTHGIRGSAMPGFQDRLAENDRWDLINFLRAMASAEEARPMSPLVDPVPRLVAPDFRFGIGVGAGKTLKEYRGSAIVHLVLFTLPDSLPRLEQLDVAAWQIASAGARVLAVPMREAGQVYQKLGARVTNVVLVMDGSQEVVETYTLFRRTLAAEGLPPIPSHMEFLIDRQGYIRVRWIPGEGAGWAELPKLLREIQRLTEKAPRAPAPEEHVH